MSKVTTSASGASEAEVREFEKGVELLYKKKWAQARKSLDKVAESHPRSTLGERARRMLEVVDARSAETTDGDDNYLNAVVAKNEGSLEEALKICNRGDLKGSDERFAYLAAAVECLRENLEESMKMLDRSIEMNPENRVHAFHDPDFEGLREDSAYADLFAVD